MKAKDTVMDIAEDKYDGLGADSLVEIQAEISFKAGREEGFILSKVTDPVLISQAGHEELNRRAKAFLDDVKKAGIRELELIGCNGKHNTQLKLIIGRLQKESEKLQERLRDYENPNW